MRRTWMLLVAKYDDKIAAHVCTGTDDDWYVGDTVFNAIEKACVANKAINTVSIKKVDTVQYEAVVNMTDNSLHGTNFRKAVIINGLCTGSTAKLERLDA